MNIYVVQQGDTLFSIADKYGVSVERLAIDNGLILSVQLVPGQTIVVAYPQKSYIVQEGDTLFGIASENGVTVIQLLRNNPYLSDRDYIYPGETIVISYDNSKGKITTNGYVNPFIDMATLKRTMPFLSYLSILGNRTTSDAEIMGIEDEKIIQLATQYHVAPIMLISTFTYQGIENPETLYRLLYDEILVDRHIENILSILKSKGYYGVNISFQIINEENRQAFEDYTRKVTTRLKGEGYLVFVTISENFILSADRILFEKLDFTNIGNMVDGVTFLNYNWGYNFGPPGPVASVYMMRKFLDYMITMIPPEKIEIGLPIIGYDWELPYVIGETKANALTLVSAVILARDVGAVIQFDEVSKTPFYGYIDDRGEIPRRHVVWFVDARSINEILNMVIEYGFGGSGIWNIMYYYPQLWLVTNSQYEIETLLS